VKLSEAIRLGAMMRPQAFGTVFDGIGTCAMGAACDAVGANYYNMRDSDELGMNHDDCVPCPACGKRPQEFVYASTIAGNIAHLNDHHFWTREAIADWVETIEAQQDQPAIEQPALVEA
jgi:hypothetical protein